MLKNKHKYLNGVKVRSYSVKDKELLKIDHENSKIILLEDDLIVFSDD